MNEEQYDKAKRLREERFKLEKELNIWHNDLTSSDGLGYLQKWNSLHAVPLKSSMPSEVFDGFKSSVINSLKVRLAEIEDEFNDL